MTTTTAETTTLGNTVLNTLGYNIRVEPAAKIRRRGRGTEVPRRDGILRDRPRTEPSQLDLSMWVTDRDADGVPGGTAQLEENIDTIITEVGPTRDLVTVTKVRQSASGLLTVTADVEIDGTVQRTRQGEKLVSLFIPLRMPFPYWEGTEVSEAITDAAGSGVVTNPGHVEAQRVTVELAAGGSGWTDPVVNCVQSATTITVNGTIPASETWTVDRWAGTVKDSSGDSQSGLVTVDATFFELDPGSNTVEVTDSGGSGTATVRFKPPYMW